MIRDGRQHVGGNREDVGAGQEALGHLHGVANAGREDLGGDAVVRVDVGDLEDQARARVARSPPEATYSLFAVFASPSPSQ